MQRRCRPARSSSGVWTRCSSRSTSCSPATLPVDVPPARTDDHVLAVTRRLAQLTAPWSLHAGPTLALPAGRHGSSGMPVGMQLTGAVGGEHLLLDAGAWFQQRTPWHTHRPPCSVD